MSSRFRWPGRVIGPKSDPYMLRWHLFLVGNLPRIFVHKFLRSDYDRALHNHPWAFVSILLWGEYVENTLDGPIHRKAPSIVYRPLTHRHRIDLVGYQTKQEYELIGLVLTNGLPLSMLPKVREKPCWTLFITGPEVRRWGFFCPKGYVDSANFNGCED